MNCDVDYFFNPHAIDGDQIPNLLKQSVNAQACEQAYSIISHWTGYAVTPLRSLESVAKENGVGAVYYKDESDRFGLKSFKALGGAYAVYCSLVDYIKQKTGKTATPDELLSGAFAEYSNAFTVASATAGNHGRSVAWGAQMFGCQCVIFIHNGVSDIRSDAIAAFGAQIIRVDGSYDDSVRMAASTADDKGWTIVSDTSYQGYTEIPKRVMQGYTVMLRELIEQLGENLPTHIVVQGGVGGLAATVAAFFMLEYGVRRPKIIVVEPKQADCLYQSARAGAPVPALGNLDSVLLGMACGEVSLLAWQILQQCADSFMVVSDSDAIDAMRYLNKTTWDSHNIIAGECAGAGLAALKLLANDKAFRCDMKLDSNSRVLLFGTEGDTDPQSYAEIMAEAS